MKNWKYINGAEIGNALKYTSLEEAKKMCKQMNDSLAPDAALRHYRHVYEKDGAYYVMETGEATAKGMKRVGNSKIGNSIYSELNKGDKRVVIESDGSWYVYDKNDKIVEQGRESNTDNAFGKFKAKGYNKKTCNTDGAAKVGNAGITDKEFKSESELRRWCMDHNYTYTPVGGGYYRLEDDSGKNRRDMEAHVSSETGNSTEKLFYGLSKDAEKEEEKSDEALDDLKKTGNRIIEKESEMSQELKNLLKKAPEWIKEKIQFAFSHGFTIDEKDYINAIKKEVGNATPNYRYKGFLITNPEGEYVVFLQDGIHVAFRGTRSKAMAEDWCDWHDPKTGKVLNSKVGNYKTGTSKLKPGDKVESFGSVGIVKSIKGENEDNIYGEPLIEVEFKTGTKKVVPEHYLIKVGNSTVSEYNSEIQRLTRKAEQLRRMGQGKQAMEVEKQIEKLGKELHELGNKKTENGLARARNAMNKKCGNSQITLWKGNNSALVSDDGLVQYLENNSFETDRDKYDSQQTAIEELKKLGYRKK